jgi:hypothetical protein
MYYRVLFTESDEHEPRISVVDDPAIQVKSVMLKKQIKEAEPIKLSKFHKFNDDKQILSGLALVADKWIERYDAATDKTYFIMFTPDQISLYKDAFISNGGKINFEHTDRMVEAEVLQCCLIGEEELKYPLEGDYKDGDLFLAVHIKNTEDWIEIKQGKHNGFSIEGVFNHRLIEFKAEEDTRLVADEATQEAMLKYLKECGQVKPEHWVEVTEEEYLNAQNQNLTTDPTARESVNDVMKSDGTGMWLVRYEYSGPVDDKNRAFCAEVMALGRIYTEEEIKNGLFNPEFGNYSIWDYKGSYGCRHVWQRKIYFEDFEDNEVRQVGNVPQVTANLDDADARTLNANLSNQNKMTEEEKVALKEELRQQILQELAAEKAEEKEEMAEEKTEEVEAAEEEKEVEKAETEVEERESEDSEKDAFTFTEEMYNGVLEAITEVKSMVEKSYEDKEEKKEEMSAQIEMSKEAKFLASYPRN